MRGGDSFSTRLGYSSGMEMVKKSIDRCDTISFDILDTLLSRSVLSTNAIFRLIELQSRKSGFADARKRAFAAAERERRNNPLSRIYEKLPDEFRGLEESEIRTEARGLFPNREMHDIWRYCLEKGKRIIIVSDMHLSSATLNTILTENGFSGYSRLYIPDECGTGGKCDLFRHVLAEEKVSPGRMLHIGDDPDRDGAIPLSLGINSGLVLSPKSQILRDFGWTRFRKYARGVPIADISLGLCARLRERDKIDTDPWAMLGGALAGPLAIGFAECCVKTAEQNGITDIFFTARDGYLIKKAVETLAGKRGITCHYVYAPRVYSYLLAYEKNDIKKHGLDRFLELIGQAAPSVLPERKGQKFPASEKRRLILENWSCLDDIRAQTDAIFRNYVGKLRAKLGGDRKVLLVDGVSGQNSAERLYRKYWNAPLCALYFSCGHAHGNSSFSYCRDTKSVTPLSFFEFFLSAPTGPVVGINGDGEPVFQNTEQNERISSVFGRMERGFDAFLVEYAELYPDTEGLFPGEETVDFFNLYLDTLNDREMALFEDMLLPGDSSESRFLTMADKIYKPFLRMGSFKLQMRKTEDAFVLRRSFRGRSHMLLSRVKS